MQFFDVVMIGLALSADAMSVTLGNLFASPNMPKTKRIMMPVAFGVFQGIMPLLGFFTGGLFATFIERYAGIISFAILGYIGGSMIWESFHPREDSDKDGLAYKKLFIQAIATSIDAFAIGVSFAAEAVEIWSSSAVIAVCTFLCCLLMLGIGRRFGLKLGKWAETIGGVILVIIGIKALLP